MSSKKSYDIILCVGPQHVQISIITIQSILHNFQFEKLRIIANKETLNQLYQYFNNHNNVYYLDEDAIIPHINFNRLKAYFEKENVITIAQDGISNSSSKCK